MSAFLYFFFLFWKRTFLVACKNVAFSYFTVLVICYIKYKSLPFLHGTRTQCSFSLSKVCVREKRKTLLLRKEKENNILWKEKMGNVNARGMKSFRFPFSPFLDNSLKYEKIKHDAMKQMQTNFLL